MSMLETPLGDRAFKLYSVAGVIMGFLFFIEQLYKGNLDFPRDLQGFELSFAGATILFLAISPLLKKNISGVSLGDLIRALVIGGFAYYPLLYVTWSSLYQLWIAFK
ncbi:MAG: hypothetical protein GSR79_06070 [Desulfurococcales archaeon]|nr:hypothetical protein [Desulfurococcales archaeon]